jgi:hypothetical protein
MRSALFIWLVWLFGVVAIWILIWQISKNWQSPKLGILRAVLRSLAVSLALAPTVLSAGYVGFPAPASVVILSYPFDTNRGNPGLVANTRFAVICFFIFWGACFLISLALFYRRKKQSAHKG